MSDHTYVACDLGAGGGRVMVGALKSGLLALEEIHRFSNVPLLPAARAVVLSSFSITEYRPT